MLEELIDLESLRENKLKNQTYLGKKSHVKKTSIKF